jgi:hypothetical protein
LQVYLKIIDGLPFVTQVSSITVLMTAGENLGGHKFVFLDNDGKVYLADKADSNKCTRLVGMTTHSCLANELVEIATQGRIASQGWGLSTSLPYFLGENGDITITPPTTGTLRNVGIAISPDIFEINLQMTIIRN